jgi:glutamine phosphoribosylpyrophosphate amidotransferase
MKLIVLPKELAPQIDTDTIMGIDNVSPENTVRYNIDKSEHIKSVLGVDDLSEYLLDESEIEIFEPIIED